MNETLLQQILSELGLRCASRSYVHVAYFCWVLTNTGHSRTIYKTPGIEFYENFFSLSGIIARKTWQVRVVADACNNENEVKKAPTLALNAHCLILKLRAL